MYVGALDQGTTWRIDRRWSPSSDGDQRERLYRTWRKTVGRTLDWLD